MLRKFFIIYRLMTSQDRKKLVWIFISSLFNGLIGVVGIASILPFIALISEPELVNENSYILMFKEYTGIYAYNQLIIIFGVLSFVLVIISNVVGSFDEWFSLKFGYEKEHSLSKRLLDNYLQQDTLSFLRKDRAEKVKAILSDIDRVIISTIFSMLDVLSGIIITSLIIILLLIVDIQATLIVCLAILVTYLLVHYFIAEKLTDLGKEYAKLETRTFDEVLESLKLFKEIKLSQSGSYFVKRYANAFEKIVANKKKQELLNLIPQNLIEIVAFGGILFIAVYFSINQSSHVSTITMIGIYAFAAYRLLPAISDIFDNFEKIYYGSAILIPLVKEINQTSPINKQNHQVLNFSNTLSLQKISFKFQEDVPFQFDQLSIELKANQFYVLTGKTGCGKSTLLYLLAGLYAPQSGSIYLDDKPVTLYENSHWHAMLGYVPTKVEMLNQSIYKNIAIGKKLVDIDFARVKQLSKFFELDELIMSLPQTYDTCYTSRGIQFSSGQIQKIGLARALYHQPKILLLDEATNAFDIATESRILNNLKKEFKGTIIFVSHRPSVREFADKIIDVEKLLINHA